MLQRSLRHLRAPRLTARRTAGFGPAARQPAPAPHPQPLTGAQVVLMPVVPYANAYPPPQYQYPYPYPPPQPAPVQAAATATPEQASFLERVLRLTLRYALLGLFFFFVGAALRTAEEEEEDEYTRKKKAMAGQPLKEGRGRFIFNKLMPSQVKPVDLTSEVHRVFFDDVRGCDEAKHELRELAEFLKNPSKYTRLGGQLPKGVLLMGPPGTGKTMLAKAVANEAGVPFFYQSGSDFEEALVGVGAARVRDLFTAAKAHAPCLVFIDEIDAVGFSRKGKYMTNPHAHQALNQLLSEMDGFKAADNVIVIGATNHQEALDQALIRPGRFDKQVAVNPPDVQGRADILTQRLRRIVTDASVDAKIIARGTPGFVGADLANLVNIAAVMAAGEDAAAVSMGHLEEAKERVLMGNALRGRRITELEKKITAYHEGGHALVALTMEGSDPLYKATIIPRGRSLGMTTVLPEDENNRTRQQMLAKLVMCMGGRVAEEVVFGEKNITTGASNDFQVATTIAEHMVRRYGMSCVGPQDFQTQLEQQTLSEQTKHLLEAEVKSLIDASYATAQSIIKEKEKELHLLASALIEHETLDADQMRSLIRGEKLAPAVPVPVPV